MGVATAEEQWECRCTLLNANAFSRCVACDRPKPRDSGRTSPPPCIPDEGTTVMTPAAGTVVAAAAAAAAAAWSGGSSIESPASTPVSVKRGRKRNSSAGQYKRLKTLPGGRHGTSALSPGFVVVTNHYNSGGGASPLSAVASATGGERKRAGSGGSSSKANGGSSGRGARSSSAPTDVAGAVGAAAAAAAAVASSAGESSGDSEGAAATAAASRQHRAMELHKVKRKAVGAALARSALSKLRFLTWEDVSVDWCPAERLTEAERRSSGLLEISELGAGARARDSGGRSSRGGDATPPTAGAAGVAAEPKVETGPAPAPAPNEGADLCMGDLFPLPPPRPPRYVKKGVLAVEPVAAAPAAASELPPAPPSPPRPTSDAAPEVGVAKPSGDKATEASEGSRQVCGNGAALAGNGLGAGGAETNSNNSNSDQAASTSTTTAADTNTTQYAMSAAARMKAYKGIFRTGADKLKKRPRSPVACTPLHLPFPAAPGGHGGGGVGLASADLEERPPCGSDGYAQTEFGSEWAWGLLDEAREGGGGEGLDRGVGGAEGGGGSNGGGHEGAGGKRGGGGGPRHRDFRLPYDVIYDCHNQDFLGEMRQLGMRSAEDAMGEFKGITSNVYLSRKVSLVDVCMRVPAFSARARAYILPAGTVLFFVSGLHKPTCFLSSPWVCRG